MQQRFLLQFLLLTQHVSGTTMPIIRSSWVSYSGCCLWYFVLWFSSCWSGVELRVMCPVCRMLQHPLGTDHGSPCIRAAHFRNHWSCRCRQSNHDSSEVKSALYQLYYPGCTGLLPTTWQTMKTCQRDHLIIQLMCCALWKRIRLHSAQHTRHTGHTMPP